MQSIRQLRTSRDVRRRRSADGHRTRTRHIRPKGHIARHGQRGALLELRRSGGEALLKVADDLVKVLIELHDRQCLAGIALDQVVGVVEGKAVLA